MTIAKAGATASMVAMTALAPAAWGTTYFVTTEWLPENRPLLVAALRALPAGLLLVAFGRTLPRGAWWWKATVLGVLNVGAFFALLFISAYRLPGGVAATLGAVQPLIVLGLTTVLLRERVSTRAIVTGITGLIGVAMLVLKADAALDAWGVLAGFAGAASMATGVVLTKRWGRPVGVGTVPFTGWLLTAGGLVLLPPALLLEGTPDHINVSEATALVYMTVFNTALTYFLWVRGIQSLPATRIAHLGLLSPVVATTIGMIFAGETLSRWQGVGMIIALGSLAVAQTSTPRSDRRAGRELVPQRDPSGLPGVCPPLLTPTSGLRH